MDIAGEGGHVITTWDRLVHCGIMGLVSGMFSKSDSDSGFNSKGAFPMRSGGVALGNMGDDLVAVFRSKDMRSGMVKEG